MHTVAGGFGLLLAQLAKRDALAARAAHLAAVSDTELTQEEKAEREQVGKRLAKLEKIRPFRYSHQGSLTYIGSDRAITDLPIFGSGNVSLWQNFCHS